MIPVFFNFSPLFTDISSWREAEFSNLIKQMQAHAKKKIFSCKVCESSFWSYSSVNSSIKSHKRNNCHSCKVWTWTFFYDSYFKVLGIFKTWHLLERNFLLVKCIIGFLHRLKKHMETRKEEKEYYCEMYGWRFSWNP